MPIELALVSEKEIELKDNGEGAKSAPIVILARTTKPVLYRYSWDEEPIYIVHDFSGMKHKNHISIDWGHSGWNMIGYANKFNVTDEGLVLGGAIIPYEQDKGTELIYKYKQGVPFEASISCRLDDGGVTEWVPEGYTTEVNGVEVDGPVLVYRKWTLSAVAICQSGVDSDTNIVMSKKKEGIKTETLKIELTEKNKGDQPMKNEQVEANKKNQEAVDTETEFSAIAETPAETSLEVVEAETPEAATEVAAVEGGEVESEDTEANVDAQSESDVEAKEEESTVEHEDSKEESVEDSKEGESVEMQNKLTGKDYMDTFGETKGAIYFAKGLSMDEAYKEHIAHLNAELASAKEVAEKAGFNRGNEPVELSAKDNADDNTLTSLEDFFKQK